MKILSAATSFAVLSLILMGASGCQKGAQESAPEAPPAASYPAEEQAVPQEAAGEKSGESLFVQHCAVCHPGGGNIINPEKTLTLEHRTKHGLTSVESIVALMRNPGPGMSVFGEDLLSDEEARMIAGYILETFK